LDKERIAAAALAVADERGVSGFTMRAVADALGVTPMALYHHVADKSELIELVVDAAISERPLPPGTGNWQEDLWQLANWEREGARAHPTTSQLLRVSGAWSSKMLHMEERWIGIWQQSGLPLREALMAATASSLAIFGYVDNELRLQDMARPDEAMLAWLPNTRSLFTADLDPDTEFELLVRGLIEGLHTQMHRLGDRAPRSRSVPAKTSH
jgi:AcrR family transcriptional regulator